MSLVGFAGLGYLGLKKRYMKVKSLSYAFLRDDHV
jgi:hypothetical protein